MSQNEIKKSLSGQFRRSLMMFKEAVLAFPPDEWRKGDLDYLRPAGVAYHVLETIDFYAGDQSADQFPWGGRFAVDWEDHDSARLPSQDQLVVYLGEIEQKLEDWLERTDLLSPERTFSYTGATALARALYGLRHVQHHVAEMSLELTRRGCQPPDWK